VLSVLVRWDVLVRTFVNVMEAFETALPEGSVTVPRTEPDSNWAWLRAADKSRSADTLVALRICMTFVLNLHSGKQGITTSLLRRNSVVTGMGGWNRIVAEIPE
jgi:hypothetical protein